MNDDKEKFDLFAYEHIVLVIGLLLSAAILYLSH